MADLREITPEQLQEILEGHRRWLESEEFRQWNLAIQPDKQKYVNGRADLSWADLTGAKLEGAKLLEANLTEAKFFTANLTEANLSDTIISGARLDGASFLRADLTNAVLVGGESENEQETDQKQEQKERDVNYDGWLGDQEVSKTDVPAEKAILPDPTVAGTNFGMSILIRREASRLPQRLSR